MIKNFLFPSKSSDTATSLGLLIIRVVLGAMMMTHGYGKLTHFDETVAMMQMPAIMVGLAVFAEFFCAMGLIVGLLYRLALIPLIVTMAVAFFVAHSGIPTEGEMALLYLSAFVGLFITGAGKFSIDRFFARKD